MKIAVTGHKSGIGKAIYTLLSQTHTVIGFDLDTINLEKQSDRNSIIEQIKDYDVFINNAFGNGSQMPMFTEILEQWKEDSSKLIINVGSTMKFKRNIGSMTTDMALFPPHYINLKKELYNKTISSTFLDDTKCKVSIIQPGFTKTKFTEELDFEQMEPEQVAEQVKYIIESDVHIVDITFTK